jgi:hypothetical protein
MWYVLLDYLLRRLHYILYSLVLGTGTWILEAARTWKVRVRVLSLSPL